MLLNGLRLNLEFGREATLDVIPQVSYCTQLSNINPILYEEQVRLYGRFGKVDLPCYVLSHYTIVMISQFLYIFRYVT
jgi:hypothetical protein